MKKTLVVFRIFVGDEILPSYAGIIINHEIRLPIKQPAFMEIEAVFLSVAYLCFMFISTLGERVTS